ncbi:cyclophilin-like fold protein [Pediococcus pentosaceus]|jgi:hypothetical protein|uniref:Cyclophilin-like domain-containing protein n=1 Tax=Pediococcus pentosaceus TaxID=1255 RepID=A0A6L5A5W1_PEDPE|nr:cyclophilin-like fold protein [Pediococcus pentosaceus]KAF0413609.1 hypothetical protein GBO79_06545 [Pediococcus pentosaceus]KAF0503923.1 hypothetical protein GBP22_03445 [Pediococcus pentosaceus]MBF7120285.1 hypothetical protein [Pediococcus pentosaceus]MBF7127297.1 hypothetical protein [Pediococcus pentosaceus]MBU7002132.1 hypothetical protein [Pediococcus pentosaceus]
MSKKILIELTINHQQKLTAQFEDNVTTQALIAKMPFTIQMDNLYSREMCYRFGRGGLPIDKNVGNRSYQIGDISYWPPMGSLVFLYKQNGEIFEQQPIGHIDSNLTCFSQLTSADVKFAIKA